MTGSPVADTLVHRLRGGKRRTQESADDSWADASSQGSEEMTDVSGLSDASTSGTYIDGDGVAHVSVSDGEDWATLFPNDSTVRIVYEGSGSTEELLLVPVSGSDSTSVSTDGSGSVYAAEDTASPVYTLPTGSSASASSSGSEEATPVSTSTASSTSVAYVASAVGIVAVIVVVGLVIFNRRAQRRHSPPDPTRVTEPFVANALPRRGSRPQSTLDTDIPSGQWRGGQHSADTTGNQSSSFSGTDILSDNDTIPAHRRGTVDVPSSYAAHRQARAGEARLQDLVDRGRYRAGTAPVILYEQNT
ncbi:hypothetical protein BBJ28_00015787 [Nothophytophthora sp. Chile5]|nr:hypothetical protein BBJ28_00015787 [Nothophytophthora sp. Chile5]